MWNSSVVPVGWYKRSVKKAFRCAASASCIHRIDHKVTYGSPRPPAMCVVKTRARGQVRATAVARQSNPQSASREQRRGGEMGGVGFEAMPRCLGDPTPDRQNSRWLPYVVLGEARTARA